MPFGQIEKIFYLAADGHRLTEILSSADLADEKLSSASGKILLFAKARIVSFGQCWRTHAGNVRFRMRLSLAGRP